MVDGREKTPLYDAYERAISELGLQILKTSLPDSKRFRKEMSSERQTVFRSTLFPPDKHLLKDSNIEKLVSGDEVKRQQITAVIDRHIKSLFPEIANESNDNDYGDFNIADFLS
jgi:hypothetical protein